MDGPNIAAGGRLSCPDTAPIAPFTHGSGGDVDCMAGTTSTTKSVIPDQEAPQTKGETLMKMTTEEAFVKVLQMHGIEHAFGIIGSAFMPISDLFPKAGITFWDVRARDATAA